MEFVYEPDRILEHLARRGVKFVLVGGLAATLHGSPVITADVDIVYERSKENLQRLADVLTELNARLRGVDDELPFKPDVETLEAGQNFTFVTDIGNLDCLGWPDGIRDYEELRRDAVELKLGERTVLAASIDDLITMKSASNRPKDREGVMYLKELKEMTQGEATR
jgi:hypothetical protein